MSFESQVPTTVEEVETKLREIAPEDKLISANLIGIFKCRIGLGDSLLDAYEAALKAYIKAVNAAPQ